MNKNRIPQIKGGIYYLLVDDQAQWSPDLETFHRRIAYKITDRLGLEEGARITLEFDPSHEEVKFHSIKILRAGNILDRFSESKIKIYQREKELNKGIVDGHLTAHVDIQDLRVGDIVEYGFSIITRPELALNEFTANVRFHWSIPVGSYRYRLILPSHKNLTIRKLGTKLPSVTKTNKAGKTTFEWIIEDADPVKEENHTPEWYLSGVILLSTFTSWQQVAEGLTPYYQIKPEFPLSFTAKVDKIAEIFPDHNDRITEALRLVQDTIRYVGIEIGPGALIPRKPKETINLGYGDCKDKAMLLISALKQLNIEAIPALVHLKKGAGLSQRLPSLGAFDHLIVRIRLLGKTYWVDPTLSHQGGRFPHISTPNYGYALPISPKSKTLEKIIPDQLVEPSIKLIETFAFPPFDEDDLSLLTRTIYEGADADQFRYQIAERSTPQLKQAYVDYYNKLYPGIKTSAPMKIEDSRDKNRIVVEEFYYLSWKNLNKNDLGKNFPLFASIFDNLLKKPNPSGRVLPITLTYPLHRQHKINVLGLKERFTPPKKFTINNETLQYNLEHIRFFETHFVVYEAVFF